MNITLVYVTTFLVHGNINVALQRFFGFTVYVTRQRGRETRQGFCCASNTRQTVHGLDWYQK
jgi:hypothetical protein